ncbi:hypothetical protein DQ04_00231170 [Trypanosoma grayi]|uniref:hypothetical protein n=1 Tax=Trypanosoma grayi TaxID=71804 RepID=UPI0004F4962B|nr:hypothetical protein DQ04_00231170 [Trypanosoma grayi]KEG14991.1 hypothetical protein DQ04_00231170 [Trypanosoma grayi]
MPLSHEKRNAVVSFYLQEQDDAVLCAFGCDYFDGARKGAACGGLFTAWLARRTYVDLRDDYMEYAASIPRHMRDNSWTIIRGFRTRPFFTVGCISLVMTTLMKSVKFTLANYRYQEFVADDMDFELLEKELSSTPEGKSELERLFKEVSKTTTAASLRDDAAGTRGPRGQTVTNTLMKEASQVCERSAPTFWDGVAVGLMGSIMDCYLPSKPVYNYYGMRCGMRI